MSNHHAGGVSPSEGVITVMFIDIVSSSAMIPVAGGIEALKAVDRLKEIIRHYVADHQGSVVKSIGDGYFIAFSDPAKAVQSAVAIQRALAEQPIETPIGSLRVRIGLHSGEAEVQEGIFGSEYIGAAVDKAARIEELAEPGQVLTSQEVVNEVKKRLKLKFQLKGQHVLKGLGKEPIWEVIWSGIRSQPKPRAR